MNRKDDACAASGITLSTPKRILNQTESQMTEGKRKLLTIQSVLRNHTSIDATVNKIPRVGRAEGTVI